MDHFAGRQQQQYNNQLRGPKPPPVSTNPAQDDHRRRRRAGGPVIVYVKSPDVIHVRPEEFMGLVQSLTGKRDDHAPDAHPTVHSTSLPAPVDDVDFNGRPGRLDEEWGGDQAPGTSNNNYYMSGSGNDVNYCENWEGFEYY